MAKTNAQRQAAFRARRQLTPRNESIFWRAIFGAYRAGAADAREKYDYTNVRDALARTADYLERSHRPDADDHEVAALLRALEASLSRITPPASA